MLVGFELEDKFESFRASKTLVSKLSLPCCQVSFTPFVVLRTGFVSSAEEFLVEISSCTVRINDRS